MTISDDLVRRGHFPKEFPPSFNTVSFADFADAITRPAIERLLPKEPSRCLCHNIARPAGMRRQLSVPNPGHHFALAALIEDAWHSDLEPLLAKASFAASSPVRATTGRAFVPRVSSGTADLRANRRTAGRYLLTSDIQNFYPSIYTHSIPWALHTKVAAKKDRTPKLIGNSLDAALRQAQDGQTVGIPIGPDSSMVLAECLLSAVEAKLSARMPGLQGYRFWDDIELVFGTQGEAEQAVGELQEILSEFELSLNPRKTCVVELPIPIEEDGIPEIRTWNLEPTTAGLKWDLHGFFDHVFRTVAGARGGHAAAFALGRLRAMPLDAELWELVQANALQLLVAEPSSARHVASLFEAAVARGHSVSKDGIALATERLAVRHTALGQGSEIAWALWLCIQNKVHISTLTAEAVTRLQDDLVGLLVLHAESLSLMPTSLDVSSWEQYMVPDELFGPHWLLSYEARTKGWLPSTGVADHIADDPFFSALRTAGVSFYDVSASGVGAAFGVASGSSIGIGEPYGQ